MNPDAFGECRSLLARPPSAEVFGALCELLGLAPDAILRIERDPPEELLRYARDLLARWPEEVPRVVPNAWFEFVAHALRPLPSVSLCNTLVSSSSSYGPEELEAFLTAEYTDGITAIDLSALELYEDVSHILNVARCAPSLKILSFAYYKYGDASSLARATRLTSLTTLDWRYGEIDDEGLEDLAAATHLSCLEVLRLQHNAFGERGAVALAEAEHLTSLRELDLRFNAIGAEGAAALAAAEHLVSLERLLLYRADVGAEGAAALANSPHLSADIRRYWRAQCIT